MSNKNFHKNGDSAERLTPRLHGSIGALVHVWLVIVSSHLYLPFMVLVLGNIDSQSQLCLKYDAHNMCRWLTLG